MLMISLCDYCGAQFTIRNRCQSFCSIQCSNRAHLNNKHRNFVLPKKYSEDLAELVGILLGDGSVTTYFTKVFLNLSGERSYGEFVRSLFENIFPAIPVSIYERPNRGVLEIQVSSVDIGRYLTNIGFNARARCIPFWILENPLYIKAAVRGLFDTEGTVGIKYYRGKSGNAFYKQLTVTNCNKNILVFLETSLVANGFKPTFNAHKNIYISNKLDIQRYMDDIGSHNPKLLQKLKQERIGDYTYGGLRRMVSH